MKPPVSLLLVDDDAAFRHVLSNELSRAGYAVTSAATGEEALKRLEQFEPEVVLLDLRLPSMDGLEVLKGICGKGMGCEVIMLTGHGSIDTAIQSIRMGAFDYVVKPCPLDELQVRIQRAVERRSLRLRASLLERGLTPPDLRSSFVGKSDGFNRLLHLIEKVAPTDSTVLITGETGSGKERVAKLIHGQSLRRHRPFIVVDCAALQESLLQSELFGHERGAYTGADRAKPGLFEVAHGGTIFLDEIGEISPTIQLNLLRVLDTSTFRHLGGTSEIRVDVRVLAATNRELPAMVRQGVFREDLFYRMSTITVDVPPLRQRGEDVELLAGHFVAVLNERYGSYKRLSGEALQVLRGHCWPGNVRELQHVIESAVVVCDDDIIQPQHIPLPVTLSPVPEVLGSGPANGNLPTLDELERRHIRFVLQSTGGHRGNAARILGISERNLYRKLHDLSLLS